MRLYGRQFSSGGCPCVKWTQAASDLKAAYMKRTVRFEIADPCHENWQQMQPKEEGRFCGSCQKTVVDFTTMSDQEVLQYISRAGSMLCGRFNNDQLSRPFYEPSPSPRFSFRYVWSVLVSGFLLLSQGAGAQAKKTAGQPAVAALKPGIQDPVKTPVTGNDTRSLTENRRTAAPPNPMVVGGVVAITQEDLQQVRPGFRLSEVLAARKAKDCHDRTQDISGIVTDAATGEPIRYASIAVRGVGAVAVADTSGRFKLSAPSVVDSVMLDVSAVGYNGATYTWQPGNKVPQVIALSPTSAQLKEVVVMGYSRMGKVATVGGTMAYVKMSRLEQVQRSLVDLWPGKKHVMVYPNPVTPGAGVKIELQPAKTGNYQLELLDAGGRLVHVQALQVTQSPQVFTLPTLSAWSRGVYWVRISGGSDRKVYQAKLLLQ